MEVKGLSKSFNDLLVLDKISFNIKKGEILSILGPSGSGKTTLLKCLIGLETFNSSIESVKIHSQNSNDYLKKNRIAYVPQRFSNYPWLNVFENIKLGMINHNKEHLSFKVTSLHEPALFIPVSLEKESKKEKQNRLLNEEKDKKVMEIIEAVGLSGFEKYYIDKLSGGMQQRVAIGRALAQDTDIIAFDEPFGALDFKIRESLQLLVKKLNKTILFVTHEIEEAIFIADHLIILSKIPASLTIEYRLPFKDKMESSIKFEQTFINIKKEIQNILTQADDLIIELRKTGTIKSLPIEQIISFPYLDALRNLVNEKDDRETIFKMINNNENEIDIQIGVMLLRKFKDDNQINDTLIKRFNNNISVKNKFYLMHELSHREDDPIIRQKLWNYIKSNIEDYKQWEINDYFHGKQETYNACIQRLYNPEQRKKAWVYLVDLALTEMSEAKLFIKTYPNIEDKFVYSIIQELLSKWGQFHIR